MRLNRFIAMATGLSRRSADDLIQNRRVQINGQPASLGQTVVESDIVTLDGKELAAQATKTIVFHKPTGYVTSRSQQGKSPTIYELLPQELSHLKPVGRLDKDSSGLLVLTNDGSLANRLTHPSANKEKVYEVRLNKPLSSPDIKKLQTGIQLEDGPSQLKVRVLPNRLYEVRLYEGRNRQIRRTFSAVGYSVTYLHRTKIGNIGLGDLPKGKYRELKQD